MLGACQTVAPKPQTNINQFLHDELFPTYLSYELETAETIFHLSPEMKEFMDENIMVKSDPRDRMRALASGIFEHSDVSILYQNDANTIAADTFNNRMANCLSLTIMTYALADYAGIGVDFQEVDIPELWVRRDGSSMLNKHVNLKLFRKRENSIITKDGEKFIVWDMSRNYTVDFDQQLAKKRFPKHVISKERVLAMFYNNNGVDALIVNNYDKAYSYFKKALQQDPTLMDTFSNLGVLYRRMGHSDKAEQNFDFALTLAPGDYSVMENLASLYRVTNRVELAEQITDELQRKRQDNPYYHYLLGQKALEQLDAEQAKKHFRRAINLLNGNHEFYFAMAQTEYLLGNEESSQRYMKQAIRYSDSEADEERYQHKIDKLVRLTKLSSNNGP